MCLAAECNRRQVASTRGHLGQPGAGGADRLVGRRRRSRGHGGGGVADAPLLPPSSRHFLVLIRHLKLRELTCLGKIFFVGQYFLKVVIILLWENNCLICFEQLKILLVKNYLNSCLEFVIVKSIIS
jgi:hypothetical protein